MRLFMLIILSVTDDGRAQQPGVALREQIANDPAWELVEPESGWCGVKALWLATTAFDLGVSLGEVREAAVNNGAASDLGIVSLQCLAQSAEGFGMGASASRCTPEALEKWSGLAITVHRHPNAGEIHHALLYLWSDHTARYVIDPYDPSRIRMIEHDHFVRSWTGETILLTRERSEMETVLREVYAEKVLGGSAVLLWIAVALLLFRYGCVPRSGVLAVAASVALVINGCCRATAPDGVGIAVSPSWVPETRRCRDDEIARHTCIVTNTNSYSVQVSVQCDCTCTTASNAEFVLSPGEAVPLQILTNVVGRAGLFTTHAEVLVANADDTEESMQSVGTIELTYEVVPRSRGEPASVDSGDSGLGVVDRVNEGLDAE